MTNFSKIISIIFQPIAIPLYCVLIFVNFEPYNFLYNFEYKAFTVAITAFLTLIIPLTALFFQYKTGIISDFSISNRKQRLPLYIISLISYILCSLCMKILRIEPFFTLLFNCSILSVIILIIINSWWKISAHASGAGTLCGMVFSFAFFTNGNPVLLFCSVILTAGLVITSRLILKAHTLGQVTAGFFNGLFFSLLPVFFLHFLLY